MSALAEARALLPPWVRWLAAPSVVAWVVAVSWAVTWIAVWATRGRRPPSLDGLHWTEVARRTWPVRQSVSKLATGLPLVAFALLHSLPFAASAMPRWLPTLAAPVLVWLAVMQVGRRISRAWRAAPIPLADLVRLELERWIVWYPHVAGLVVVAFVMPRTFGATTVALVATSAAAVVAVQFGAALGVARMLGLVRPPGARLVSLVATAAEREGRSPPRALELRSPLATAAALPGNDAILISTRTLELLDDEELGAVLAHELAHLGESRASKILRTVGPLLLLPATLFRPIAAATSPLVALYAAIGPLFLQLPLRAFARRMEVRADALAVAGRTDPEPYVRALVALHRDSAAPAVTATRTTHPSLYDRMLAAGIQPDFPRPAPPTNDGGGAIRVVVAVAVLGAMLGSTKPFWDMAPLDDAQHRAVTIEMLLTGGTAEELGELAEQRRAAGRPDDAMTLLAGAIAVDDWWGYRGRLAALLAAAGRCDEAWLQLGLAREQALGVWRDILGRPSEAPHGSVRSGWIDDQQDDVALRCPRDTDESAP